MQETIIQQTVTHVQECLKAAEAGHDWWHVRRVWNLARLINKSEPGNPLIVELGALLHDIADAKFHHGNEELGPEKTRKFLNSQGVGEAVIEPVVQIVRHISFKGGNENQPYRSAELGIVQDADRLDAMGAVGIARAFHYGGYKNREIYNPDILPDLQMNATTYRKSKAPSINHFYEKLLLLKDRMNTATGRKLAEERHQFMGAFLEQFYREWQEGE
jgi:uncharacterized protein